jgi:ribosomal-protein-alanine N-acetyltransferase
MIGTCSFERFSEDRRGEVGFDLAHDWWGQGLMAEALRAIMDYGFEVLKLKAVYAITDPGNYRALRLLKRLGFLLEGEKDRALCLLLKRRAWKLFHT